MDKQELFLFDGRLYVSYSFLFSKNVPTQSVYNQTSRKAKKPWRVVRHPSNKHMKLVDYSSIPVKYIEYYKLPHINKLEVIARRQRLKLEKDFNEKSKSFQKVALDIEYENYWKELIPLYENIFINYEIIECYCKTHVVFNRCKELYNHGARIRDLYHAYSRYDDLVFQSLSYSSFCNKFRKIRDADSIDDVLIHGLKGRISNNMKMSSDVIIEIKKHFSNPKKLNACHIIRKS